MQPNAVPARDRGDRGDRIDRGRRRRADRGDDRARQVAVGEILFDHFGERVGAHRIFARRTERAADCRGRSRRAARPCRLSYARAPTRTRAAARFALQAAARQRIVGRPLAGADQRDECAGRGGVLDHAAPRRRKPEHLPEPVGDDLFDFCQRWARLPGEADHAEAGADDVAEHAREQRVGGEIAEEARMLPKRKARNDEAIEIRDRRAKVLRLVGRRGGQGVADLAWPGFRHHRPVGQAFMIVGEPVDQLDGHSGGILQATRSVLVSARGYEVASWLGGLKSTCAMRSGGSPARQRLLDDAMDG